MAITPIKYVKKPQPVEAIVYDETNGKELAAWVGGEHVYQEKPSDPTDVSEHILIPHVKGTLIARLTMFVVKGEDGRYTACDSETFERDYQMAT